MDASALPKKSSGRFDDYYSTSKPGGFKVESSTGGSGFSFETFPEINTDHIICAVTDKLPLSYKVKTGEKNVIEYVDDDIDQIPDSDFTKASAIVFGGIYNGKSGVLPL